MKPPFKASNGAIIVIHSLWFDTCTMRIVAIWLGDYKLAALIGMT